MFKTVATDVLIIGGGCAAVCAAVKAADSGLQVTLVDKGEFQTSGSSPVSLNGLLTILTPEDSPKLLFQDLLEAGYHINDQNLIYSAARGALNNMYWLESLGLQFVKNKDGSHQITAGAGHAMRRRLHLDHIANGLNPVAILGRAAWRKGVKLFDRTMITKLLKQDNIISGAVGIAGDGSEYYFKAKAIVLAAGGANHLYPNYCKRISENRYRTTGAAFSLAFDAGASLINLEFVNFREGDDHFAARMGGRMVNTRGEKIMEKYDPERLENAPRGKLVEAIYRENQGGRGPVSWQLPDSIPREPEMLYLRYKPFEGQKIEIGIDYQRLLGGIRINERAETSIKGLYAAGESSGGFHGADRMQGASFLECTIFGAVAGDNAAKFAMGRETLKDEKEQVQEELARLNSIKGDIDPEEEIKKIQELMWHKASIVRSAPQMKKAIFELTEIRGNDIPRLSGRDLFASLETSNLALTAECVARSALAREESRGSHLRSEYPERDDKNWLKHVEVQNSDGDIGVNSVPIVILDDPVF